MESYRTQIPSNVIVRQAKACIGSFFAGVLHIWAKNPWNKLRIYEVKWQDSVDMHMLTALSPKCSPCFSVEACGMRMELLREMGE